MSELKLEVVSWIDMFRPKLIKRTIIGPILMFFQQFQGVNAVSNALPVPSQRVCQAD